MFSNMYMKYKYLEHTADIKFQAFGKSLEEAFSNSAYAMINIICEREVKSKIKKKIKISGIDSNAILYKFLEEIIFLLNTENFLLSKVSGITIKGNELKAELSGDDLNNYELELDVKAVTYNEMFIKKEKGEFTIQVVLDI